MIRGRLARGDARTLLVGFAIWFAALVAVGMPRALARHFHVDEIQFGYETALVHVHRLPEYANTTTPILTLLGFAIRPLASTFEMLAVMRLAFFAVFAATLASCAWAQPYFVSTRGRLLVLAAVTLVHPFWMNGFEIRMDVIVGCGAVVLYGLVQRAANEPSRTLRTYVIAGLCSAWMQCHSGKAIAYWVPFCAALLSIGTWKMPLRHRLRAMGALVLGLLVGAALHVGIVVAAGGGDLYAKGLAGFRNMLDTASRFSPTPELVRVALDAPLLFGAAVAQPLLTVAAMVKGRVSRRSIITMASLGWVLVVLYVNPTPFPYNFIYVTPFVFFAALDTVLVALGSTTRWRSSLLAALAVVTTAIFVHAWLRNPFLGRTNTAQLSYVRAAEALTGPDDTVLDGVGLVLSRKPPHKDWLVHSLRMKGYRDGVFTRFAQMMVEEPSPVLLDNYRWAWLSPEDLEARRMRYVPLAPRLFVLGQRLSLEAGQFPIHRKGKYAIASAPGVSVQIDDRTANDGSTLDLEVGVHRYTRTSEGIAVIHWIGPDPQAAFDAVNRIESLGPRELLFTNEPKELARR